MAVGFNPLVIGSIFQTVRPTVRARFYDRRSFNPLVIGSIFQTDTRGLSTPASRLMFQSPSNRVNIPNIQRVHHHSPREEHRFQSPSNRVNIPNLALLARPNDSKGDSFNPLVIGSIFQTLIFRWRRPTVWRKFQSPSNRVNIPNRPP